MSDRTCSKGCGMKGFTPNAESYGFRPDLLWSILQSS